MDTSWRQKRKMIFISIFSLIILSFLAYKIYPHLTKEPTCFDFKKNGDERGIDCGGSCGTICSRDILPLEVKFSRAVESEPNLYDLVAIVENKNKDKNILSSKISYEFKIYDKSGSLIKTVPGSTSLPVGQSFPIISQNIYLDFTDSGNSISKVILEFTDFSSSWIPVDPVFGKSFFTVDEAEFLDNKNDISQLKVNFSNITKATFKNLEIRALLYGEDGNVKAVNETLVKEIRSSQNDTIVMTWRKVLNIKNPRIEVFFIVTPDTEIR